VDLVEQAGLQVLLGDTLPIPVSSLVVSSLKPAKAARFIAADPRIGCVRNLDRQEICAICADFCAMPRMGMARTR
jgi:hypothetical protein